MIGDIDVTGVPLEKIIRAAYNPSRPQGLGMLHFQPGDLTDEEVAQIIGRFADSTYTAVGMDYIKGRSIKMTVRKEDGKHFVPNRWYDHSDGALRTFLETIGLSPDLIEKARAEQEAHEAACEAAALAFLQTQDGKYVMARSVSPSDLEPLVYDGLYTGQARGKIKCDYTDSGQVWSVAA